MIEYQVSSINHYYERRETVNKILERWKTLGWAFKRVEGETEFSLLSLLTKEGG
jgi:hypothetical protein